MKIEPFEGVVRSHFQHIHPPSVRWIGDVAWMGEKRILTPCIMYTASEPFEPRPFSFIPLGFLVPFLTPFLVGRFGSY